MSRSCYFCRRWFQNRQAVKAHLRFCERYKERDPVAHNERRAVPNSEKRAAMAERIPIAELQEQPIQAQPTQAQLKAQHERAEAEAQRAIAEISEALERRKAQGAKDDARHQAQLALIKARRS